MSVYCMVNIIELQCCCSVALKLSSYSWSYPLICSNNGSLYNLPSLVCFQWRFFLNVLMPQWDVAVSQGGMITQEWLLISLLDLFVLWALWHNLAAAGGVRQLFDEHRLLFVCAKKAHQSTMVHFRKASPGMLFSLDWESQLGQKNWAWVFVL